MLAMLNDGPRPQIDGNVSDLFFNLDLSSCGLTDKDGRFAGYDAGRLRAEAEWFSASLRALGVDPGSPDDIVQDFLRRI